MRLFQFSPSFQFLDRIHKYLNSLSDHFSRYIKDGPFLLLVWLDCPFSSQAWNPLHPPTPHARYLAWITVLCVTSQRAVHSLARSVSCDLCKATHLSLLKPSFLAGAHLKSQVIQQPAGKSLLWLNSSLPLNFIIHICYVWNKTKNWHPIGTVHSTPRYVSMCCVGLVHLWGHFNILINN